MTPFERIQATLGYTNYEIATVLGVSERTVVRMRKRPDNDGPEIRLLKILAGAISK
ncbi:MAG: helix-turn-helix domain-containing protein, partial [Candidatus Electrothrix sp. ATG2]|nr:helix-turn-helix domain-containing protein [Candidatus Electrothrix sp. ATG2]